MSRKIFISYRRQDSGANALGIAQYLEREFGRKNVFIDVDTRAGAKFPAVLEERLAECKVLLALIGPDWLNSKDDQGRRRLENSDDWVRLEIARALKRDITVIPVRVNSAELPTKASLPADIQGLLDHQATSVTLAGFRNEMAGLVRDISSIPDTSSHRRMWFGAAGPILLLIIGAWSYQTEAAFWGLQFGKVRELLAQATGKPAAWSIDGTYEGTGRVTYAANTNGTGYLSKVRQRVSQLLRRPEVGPISISLKQNGSKVIVNYQASTGVEGKGEGTLAGDKVETVSLQNTTPNCPGSYTATFKLSGDNLEWTYKGQDCGGALQGYGQAKKSKPDPQQ